MRHCKFGSLTNLNKHLKTESEHPMTQNWYKKYLEFTNQGSKSPIIDNKTYKLIRFIISTNTSLSQLKNPEFLEIIDSNKIKMPANFSFRNTFLPQVMRKLVSAIESKLQNADTICLITDIWTNKSMTDYIALGCVTTNSFFERGNMLLTASQTL